MDRLSAPAGSFRREHPDLGRVLGVDALEARLACLFVDPLRLLGLLPGVLGGDARRRQQRSVVGGDEARQVAGP
jgi:hypothetical protein